MPIGFSFLSIDGETLDLLLACVVTFDAFVDSAEKWLILVIVGIVEIMGLSFSVGLEIAAFVPGPALLPVASLLPPEPGRLGVDDDDRMAGSTTGLALIIFSSIMSEARKTIIS